MNGSKVAVFLHSGAYDRVHQGLAIAAAAAAQGREVDVYFFWWALDRLHRDDLDEPAFDAGRAGEEAAERFEARQAPTLRQLLSHLRELGRCRLFACTASMDWVGADVRGMERKVDGFVGWSTILQRTAGVTDRFYL